MAAAPGNAGNDAETARNVAVVRRYFAAWPRDPAALDGVIAPDCADHMAYEGQAAGIAGYREFFARMAHGFPDLATTMEDTIAVGDKVVVRWRATGTHRGEYDGIPATGRTMTLTAISIMRLAGGMIVEEWVEADNAGMRRQMTA